MLSRLQFSYQMFALERERNVVDVVEDVRELRGALLRKFALLIPSSHRTKLLKEVHYLSAAINPYLVMKHNSWSSGNYISCVLFD